MQGYCVRCRSKQEMLAATRTMMKNGRRAMLGTCAVCGTKVAVVGRWDSDPVSAPSSVGAPAQSDEPAHTAGNLLKRA